MKDESIPLTLDEHPDTWVDELSLIRPRDLLVLIRHFRGKRHRVVLPDTLMASSKEGLKDEHDARPQ